jgi:vancomycin resistance protein YoaR
MNTQDFQNYGPMKRRGRDTQPIRNMAQPYQSERGEYQRPYSSDTLQIRSYARRPPPRRVSNWWLVPLLFAIVVLATALGGLTWLDQTYAGKIYPNVSVQGVDLTEQTPAQAEAALRAQFGDFLQTPIRFEYNGQVWEPTPQEIGLRADIRSQVAEAMRAGRGNGLSSDLQQVFLIWQQGLDLPLRMTVDARQMQAYVRSIGAGLEQPAVEATMSVDTVAGTISATDSADGRMLLLDETVAQALEALETLETQSIPIKTDTLIPMLESGDIAEAKRTADAMLQAPMDVRFVQENQTFTLSQVEIADMIAVSRVDGPSGPTLNTQLNQDKLKKWATKLADKIGRASIEPRVAWNGGNLQIVQPGRTAYRLDIDQTVSRLNEMIVGSNRALDLPVEEVQPQATPETLSQLGIKEPIASGKSDFSGSAEYRITNIKNGVRLINGILVPPDGEFSFNENVGEIDAANGFVEGYAIVGNRTQLEWGGGICQVSTTLYRAAFYAGLPFSDWTAHRFRISWYEKYDSIGMDAAIFTGGGPDLRFVNDTGNWILIEGVVNDAEASVTYTIYGTKVPGREVIRTDALILEETPAPTQPVYINDPEQPVGTYKQTDTARGGMEIQVVRTVLQDGVELRSTPFITKFQAWPNIFVKHPNTPLPPGGRLGTG